jgi:AcrR family transcriptional regulator
VRTRGIAHEETRQQILRAARKLVAKKGHENLSLREAARDAGFSPASLYEYFDGKDAIVAALAREAASSLSRALAFASRRASRSKDSRAMLVELGLAYIAWAKENAEDFALLFDRLPSSRRSLKESPSADSPYALLLDAVRRAVEACGKGGKSPELPVERFAYGLWATAHGMATLQRTHLAGFQSDFGAADRQVLEALVKGWTS